MIRLLALVCMLASTTTAGAMVGGAATADFGSAGVRAAVGATGGTASAAFCCRAGGGDGLAPGVSPFTAYIAIPFGTAGFWIVASIVVGTGLGSVVIGLMSLASSVYNSHSQ